MKRRILFCLMIAYAFIITSSSYAWQWAVFETSNCNRNAVVGDPGVANDLSYSIITNNDSDEATVRAIIWGNEWPDHYHEVNDPMDGVPYFHSEIQLTNLIGHRAEIEIVNGLFPFVTSSIQVRMGYPL